jgi:protein phosphatase
MPDWNSSCCKIQALTEIVIPKNSLVMLCGPAGCGKSTFAARHFLRTQIVSSDECRALVSDDATNQRISGHAFDLMHFIIRKRLLIGRLTVADATHLKEEERRPLKILARRFGFQAVAILLNLPIEVCLARNFSRQRVVPEEAIRMQYHLFEETLQEIHREGFDSVFIFDEADQSQNEVRITRPQRRRWRQPPTPKTSIRR